MPFGSRLHKYALCVCCVQRVVEGSVVGSAGSACWCAWGVGYVVGGCNVQCSFHTEHGRFGISCMYAETVDCMSLYGMYHI